MDYGSAVSVIIPLAPRENQIRELIAGLLSVPSQPEILLCAENPPDGVPLGPKVRYVPAPDGRAACLNAGAQAAKGEWLWFLHADSALPGEAGAAVAKIMKQNLDALYYFDLRFGRDRMPLHAVTERCVFLRCRLFQAPFGDQGFLIKNVLFRRLGGYPDWDRYGEDHLFVRRARRAGVPVYPAGAPLYTSGRRYRENGFFKTTLRNQRLWISQIRRDRKRAKTIPEEEHPL